MKNGWSDDEARPFLDDPVALRAYTSRLLGREPGLVLHGGGNTSVKVEGADFFGAPVRVLYVKGSGWDLASIEPPGFAPVRMETLEQLAELDVLTDTDMVRVQRSAMLDPNAPNPSVEAILHAVIPFTFVDHSHSDAVVAITNTPGGADRIAEIYGDRVLVIPYVMPGFKLAREVVAQIHGADWSRLEGLILLNHGVFTFGEDAHTSYARMISLVTEAEEYLTREGAYDAVARGAAVVLGSEDALTLARFRGAASLAAGRALHARFNGGEIARGFADRDDAAALATRGPVTPDHVIHTKRVAALLSGDPEGAVSAFGEAYEAYFERLREPAHAALDPAPRWAVWPERGTVALGPNVKRLDVVHDIIGHTVEAIQWGEALGAWQALSEAHIFDVEYWELEQAKLQRAGSPAPFAGRVAVVTGAASGIGRACVEALRDAGAAVAALDLDSAVRDCFADPSVLPIVCDVTDPVAIASAVAATVGRYGGVDVVVSNAGTFPADQAIAAIETEAWDRTLEVNLSSHQRVLTATAPFLACGVSPAVVIIGSKNVPAPGPGVAAYSAAKAGLTQLARVAALELGGDGVRVNVLHPNAVFDTGIWTDARLAERAASYGLDVAAYKRRNVLGVEVTSRQVADLAVAMAGPLFASTTGAQVPVDGGNDRVI